MEQLVILDYTTSTVDIYDIDSEANINESYIESLGYDTGCCSWMFGENIEITKHRGMLM